jgi:hypothetical protein
MVFTHLGITKMQIFSGFQEEKRQGNKIEKKEEERRTSTLSRRSNSSNKAPNIWKKLHIF